MPVNVETALDLKLNHGLSYPQIAALQGVTAPAIYKRIKHLLPDESTKIYQNNRADVLSHLQLKLLSEVKDSKLKKINIRDAIVSAGILYDKERLERGLATANTAVIHADIAALRAQDKDKSGT